jgi:hypothetical protein
MRATAPLRWVVKLTPGAGVEGGVFLGNLVSHESFLNLID